MTNLATLLKSEITRLARKEIRTQLDPLRKSNATQRTDIAALKRQVAQQQRQLAALGRVAPRQAQAPKTTAARFSAKGLRSLRTRLGLSAADFGQIAGVSAQSIYNWETGKAIPRAAQVATLAGLRSLGKRAAQARLG